MRSNCVECYPLIYFIAYLPTFFSSFSLVKRKELILIRCLNFEPMRINWFSMRNEWIHDSFNDSKSAWEKYFYSRFQIIKLLISCDDECKKKLRLTLQMRKRRRNESLFTSLYISHNWLIDTAEIMNSNQLINRSKFSICFYWLMIKLINNIFCLNNEASACTAKFAFFDWSARGTSPVMIEIYATQETKLQKTHIKIAK